MLRALLLGTSDAIEQTFRARNLADRATRYLIDSEDHFAGDSRRATGTAAKSSGHPLVTFRPTPFPRQPIELNQQRTDVIYVIVS